MLGYAKEFSPNKFLCSECSKIDIKIKLEEINFKQIGFLLLLYHFPLFINGIYNLYLQNYLVLFFLVDISTRLFIPLIILRNFHKNFKLIDNHFSFDKKLITKIFVIFFNFIIIPLLFFLIYIISIRIFEHIFPINYFQRFSYSKNLDNYIVVLYFSLSAGIFEELFYRAYLINFLENILKNKLIIILISAFLFSSIHWENGIVNLLSTFCLGCFSALYYIKSRKVVPLIIGHFITDFILLSKFL